MMTVTAMIRPLVIVAIVATSFALCNCKSQTLSSGAPAEDFEVENILTGQTVKLSDFKGQVVFVDFWASWCPPCQAPMAENQKLMEKHAADWAGKAVILGVSLDEKLETIQEHVKSKGWTAPVQTWAVGDWKSPAAKAYKVTGVPTAVLVDKQGNIAWSGHPASIDVETKIEALLK